MGGTGLPASRRAGARLTGTDQGTARDVSSLEQARGALSVNVLGPVEAFDDSGAALACGAPRERQLLVLLALHHGHSLSAGAIIDALWGEEPPPSAAKTMQTYVFRLRRSLGHNLVERTANGYQIAIRADSLDVTRVARHSDAAEQHRGACQWTDARADLEAALALFRGELELPDTITGNALRRRVTEMHDGLVDALHDCRLEMGDAAAAVSSLESAVAATPLDERRWGQLMLALYRSGRQADALQVYQRARHELIDQVGIEPGPELRDLEQRIIIQDPTLFAVSAKSVDATAEGSSLTVASRSVSDMSWVTPEAGFVGRAVELATAQQVWDQVVAHSQRHLLLVDGDAGIGKTAFAAALARHAVTGTGSVLYAQCSPSGGGYQPFSDILSRYLEVIPAEVIEAHIGATRGDLGLLLPSLVAGADQAPPLDPDSAQQRMFAAVSRLMDEIATDAPLLLVIDDWHWATQPTMRLVHHLLRSNSGHPILIVGTYRRTDVTTVSPLRSLLGELHRTERVTTISLSGLGIDAVAEIIEQAAGHTLDHHMVAADALQSATGGNPFFVHELIFHLTESGTFVRRDGRWQTSSRGDVALPGSVREVIGLRLGRLLPETMAMLRVAAVTGLVFDVALVAGVTATSIDHVVDAAEESTAVGLLVETEHPGRFAFEHDLVRQSVLADMSATRRVRTHWAIAETLSGMGERAINELAHHAHEGLLAGEPVQAAKWMRAAALETLHRTAAETALIHTDNALKAINGIDGCEDLRADLLCDRVIALLEAGAGPTETELTVARDAAENAAIRVGDPARIVRAVTLEDRLSPSALVGIFDEHRVTAAFAALAAVPRSDRISRAHLMSQIVESYSHWSDQTTAEAFTTEALDCIRDAPRAERERVVSRLALAAGCNPSRYHLVPGLAGELADASPFGIGAALQSTTFVQASEGAFDKVQATARWLLETGRDSGTSGLQVIGYVFLACAASARGDLEALHEILAAKIPEVTARHQRMRFAIKQHVAIALEMWTGQDHGGIEAGLVFANDPPPAAPFFTHGAHIITAWTAMNAGHDDRAEEIWAKVRSEPIAHACHGLLSSVSAACATELVPRYGTTAEAAPIREVLEGQHVTWATNGPITLGPRAWYLSRLSELMGDDARAADERQHALDACEKAGLNAWRDRITNSKPPRTPN